MPGLGDVTIFLTTYLDIMTILWGYAQKIHHFTVMQRLKPGKDNTCIECTRMYYIAQPLDHSCLYPVEFLATSSAYEQHFE